MNNQSKLAAAVAVFTLFLGCPAPVLAVETDMGLCEGTEAADFICGPANAEDLVQIPGTGWVLSSRMAGPGVEGGAIYLLNVKDRSWREIDPGSLPAARDTAVYPDCGDKPTAATFSGHGIALDQSGGKTRLLAINHANREAVEVYDVAIKHGEVPSLKWVGCVVAPKNAVLNSVVARPQGIAVTKFFDTTNPKWTEDLLSGKPTGSVLEWSPQGGWSEVSGSALSGPNGLAVSPDGSTYYVAEWSNRKLHRIVPATLKHDAVETGVLADNVHWTADGKLLLTGQDVVDKQDYAACALSTAKSCPDAYRVLLVDPDTLKATEVVNRKGTAQFGSGTTALDIGTEYWIGTSRGDRIQRIMK